MKFKLDENLGRRGRDLLTASGHDVATVFDQNLSRASDPEIITVCREEQRCLVTLDLDFGNPLRFNPKDYYGIAVLRLPAKCTHEDLLTAILTLAKAVDTESIDQALWIVERERIRIYRPDS